MNRTEVVERSHQVHPMVEHLFPMEQMLRRANGANRARNVPFNRSMYAVFST